MQLKNWIVVASAVSALGMMQAPAYAVEAAALPASKRTNAGRYLDARSAYELKQKLGDKAYFVDVRSLYEVMYVGMPTVADANIPYAEHLRDSQWDDKAGRLKMEPNSGFAPELARRMQSKGLGKDNVVIVLCRSGERSARAVNLLTQLGYTNVYSVIDGFEGDLATNGPHEGQRAVNGWKNAGLPWSYKLDKERMTLPQN